MALFSPWVQPVKKTNGSAWLPVHETRFSVPRGDIMHRVENANQPAEKSVGKNEERGRD